MKYYQLFENADYNIARKQFDKLSEKAKTLLIKWGMHDNWSSGNLNIEFARNTEIAQDIWDKGQPIRDNIFQREGDTMLLFRGINSLEKGYSNDRMLFSWTSIEKIANKFAGKHENIESMLITDKHLRDVLHQYKKRGYMKFLGNKYIKIKNSPDSFKVYYNNDKNSMIQTDIEEQIKSRANVHNSLIKRHMKKQGRVIKKNIPVNDIVWVLMVGNENEYIVRGHSQ